MRDLQETVGVTYMRVSVLYFSSTGNTRWAVDEVSRCIMAKGHECGVYAIENTVPDLWKTVNDSDIIGFAFPVYGANMPNVMIRFFQEFAQVYDRRQIKPAFLVTTAGYIDAFGPISANRVLKKYADPEIYKRYRGPQVFD